MAGAFGANFQRRGHEMNARQRQVTFENLGTRTSGTAGNQLGWGENRLSPSCARMIGLRCAK